ncbi:MAG: hypothetical protein R3339_09310 [Thermodesulfobacteriota bacterium]|nr:hypothetical protein [Thermodesulfobacteriota bacterium]
MIQATSMVASPAKAMDITTTATKSSTTVNPLLSFIFFAGMFVSSEKVLG